MICKTCGNSEKNREFKIREMMFGFRDEFTYFECSKCGCIQIAEIPKNIGKYYPSNYYSFNSLPLKKENDNIIKKYLKRKRDDYALFRKGMMGKLIYTKYPHLLFYIIGFTKIDYNSKILDVGCGAGSLLYSLNKVGLKHLTGVDLYIKSEIVNNDIKVYKKSIYDLPDNQKFDLIMFNHSFEHIYDQLQTLIKVYNLLTKNGICLIRIPMKIDYIWNLYGTNWVQIDTPRHFFLHTLKSFELLVKKSDLSIKDIIFDSTEFQFWGSEQYKRDITLLAENSYPKNPEKSVFTKKEIVEFKKRAQDLNIRKQGDQAAFFLTRN
jgi:SAM-dependent methyltransferase